MKTVLISPKDYLNNIITFGTGQAEDIYLNITFEGMKKGSSNKLMLIDSKEKFEIAINDGRSQNNDTINGLFSGGDYREHQVFVVPELNWNGETVDEGYEIALKLLEALDDKAFVLHFVSMFTQELLLKMVSNDYKAMVKAFPHICVLSPQKKEEIVDPGLYSIQHFNLIKNLAISNSGMLSALLHNVRNVVGKDWGTFKENALQILGDLRITAFSNYWTMVDELKKNINDFEPGTDFNPENNPFSENLISLINQIRNETCSPDSEGSIAEKNNIYRILVIDDDKKHRKKLFDFFSKRFKHVWCNNIEDTLNAEEQQKWKEDNSEYREIWKDEGGKTRTFDLKNPWKWIKDNAHRVDAVFLDLLFQDGELWYPFSGVDLYHTIKSANAFCAIKVITSLPRYEMSIIDKEISGQVITKGYGWESLEGCLINYMNDLPEECAKNRKKREEAEQIPGPKNGFFASEKVKELVTQWRNEIADAQTGRTVMGTMFDEAERIINTAKDNNKKISLFSNKFNVNKASNQEIKEKLPIVLAHRRLALEFCAEQGTAIAKQSTAIDDEMCYQVTNNISCETDDKYFNKIGFNVTNENEKIKLNFGDSIKKNLYLYPEESEYYYKFKETLIGNGGGAFDAEAIQWLWIFWRFCKKLSPQDNPLNTFVNTQLEQVTPGQLIQALESIGKDPNWKENFKSNVWLCNQKYIEYINNRICKDKINELING